MSTHTCYTCRSPLTSSYTIKVKEKYRKISVKICDLYYEDRCRKEIRHNIEFAPITHILNKENQYLF